VTPSAAYATAYFYSGEYQQQLKTVGLLAFFTLTEELH
jgi:hypothetical protein